MSPASASLARSPSLSATATVTINLNDINEAPTANDATLALNENSPVATPVGTVGANDADAGLNGTLSYAITAGNASGAFAIDAGSGAINVADPAPLDFEINPTFALTVMVAVSVRPGVPPPSR